MLSKLSLVTVLAACVAGVVSEDIEFKLYAYGKIASSGMQLFYGDGQAYIGGTPSYVSESVDITLVKPDGDDKFIAKSNATVTTSDWSPEPTLYIDLTEGTANPLGFTNDNTTLPDGATTVGFGLYGGWAIHTLDDATVEMEFLATPTNETDIYLVKWNAGGKSDDDISITLRTQGPVSLDDK